jgi:hypothetical protein
MLTAGAITMVGMLGESTAGGGRNGNAVRFANGAFLSDFRGQKSAE